MYNKVNNGKIALTNSAASVVRGLLLSFICKLLVKTKATKIADPVLQSGKTTMNDHQNEQFCKKKSPKVSVLK